MCYRIVTSALKHDFWYAQILGALILKVDCFVARLTPAAWFRAQSKLRIWMDLQTVEYPSLMKRNLRADCGILAKAYLYQPQTGHTSSFSFPGTDPGWFLFAGNKSNFPWIGDWRIIPVRFKKFSHHSTTQRQTSVCLANVNLSGLHGTLYLRGMQAPAKAFPSLTLQLQLSFFVHPKTLESLFVGRKNVRKLCHGSATAPLNGKVRHRT